MISPSRIVAIAVLPLFATTVPLVRALAEDAIPPKHRLSKSEVRRYRASMEQAAKAVKQGKYAKAVAAFDRALAIKPDDPAALTDQGWSAFLLGTLDRAESVTRRAIAVVEERRRSAAAHYNLGRILEKRGDRAGAVAAYVKSLEVRPTRTVREQLAKIDPAKAAEMDPLQPTSMLGPFPGLEEFCKSKKLDDKGNCILPDTTIHAKNVAAPYTDAVWFQVGQFGEEKCYLAIKLSQGWFIDAKDEYCGDTPDSETMSVDLRVTDLVPGGHAEVVLHVETRNYMLDVNDEGTVRRCIDDCDVRMVACGVPMKGTPSCIRLPTAKDASCSPISEREWTWELVPVFTADGQVEVKATGAPDADARLYMGRRPLAFP